MKSKSTVQHRPVNGVDEAEKTTRFKLAPPKQDPEPTIEIPVAKVPAPESPEKLETPHEQPDPFDPWEAFDLPEPDERTERWEPVAAVDEFAPAQTEPERETEPLREPEPAPEPEAEVVEPEPERSTPKHAAYSDDLEDSDGADDSDDTEVLDELSSLLPEIAPLAQPPVEVPPPPTVQQPEVDDTEVTRQFPVAEPAEPAGPSESDRDRLERLLKFVARQEPGLRWAAGLRDDGSTLLVTDLAHGWIPPGLTLPDDVQLLEPGRRKGTATALLGPTALLATYAPGDPLGWAIDYEVTDTSFRPRELPPVDDLGWLLGEATHWRDGLPRMVNTLAKAGAAGTGVVDAEIDILRVYLDTARYQLLAQYPDVDAGLLLNCLLLAATEAIATKNVVSANYHFAWFQMLSSPPASGWKAGP